MSILTSGEVVIPVDASFFIAERARNLRWNNDIGGIKGADAIHFATALEMSCQEFITVEFTKKQPALIEKFADIGLRVIVPSDTRILPDEYKQGKIISPVQEEKDNDGEKTDC